jgi:hypothetical protein
VRGYRGFLLSLVTALLAWPWSAGAANLRVYGADGTLQCGSGGEIPLGQMRSEIEQAGVKVISQEKRQLPVAIIAVCGAPSGSVNTYEISDADWRRLRKQAPDRFAVWVFGKPTTEVFKYDGALQCGAGKAVGLDEMGAELTKAGIAISASRKDSDGLMHAQLCGSLAGSVNVFEIRSDSFEAARKLGFDYFVPAQP